jgi:hypothetical protein
MKRAKEVIKPAKFPLNITQRIVAKYGEIDEIRDFCSHDLKTYFKCVEYDDKRSYAAHEVYKL